MLALQVTRSAASSKLIVRAMLSTAPSRAAHTHNRVAEVTEGHLRYQTNPAASMNSTRLSQRPGAFSHMEVKVFSEDQTDMVARQLSKFIAPDATICLHGSLGSGKTQFARAFIRNRFWWCQDLAVPSPTYTLQQTYDPRVLAEEYQLDRESSSDHNSLLSSTELSDESDDLFNTILGTRTQSASLPFMRAEEPVVNHLDLYRLSEPSDLNALSLRDILEHSIALIEWPDRLPIQPEHRIDVRIVHEDDIPVEKRDVAESSECALNTRADIGPDQRRIVVQGFGRHANAVDGLRDALLRDRNVIDSIPRP